MKNCKGQELPQPYYDLAEMRRDQKCGVKDVTIMLSSAFNWATTLEGYDWWSSVFKGNKPSIHYASLAELDEWRKAKATISKMGTVEPDYKAMYEAEKEKAEYYEKQYNVWRYAVITPTAELQSVAQNLVADYAMAAMQGLLNDPNYKDVQHTIAGNIVTKPQPKVIAERSFDYAEAMVEEGRKRGHIN